MKKFVTLLFLAFGIFAAQKPAQAFDIGVNYKSTSTINKANDQALWSLNGLGKIPIRVDISTATTTNTSTSGIYLFTNEAKTWRDLGYYVVCGGTGATNAGNWNQYHDSIMWWAQYVKSINACDEFQVGNELEGKLSGSGLTYQNLMDNIRQLAADVKVVLPTTTISYSVSGINGSSNGSITDWVNDPSGLGSLDKLEENIYGEVLNGGLTVSATELNLLSATVQKFGASHVGVSEFNVSASDGQWRSVPVALRVVFFRQMIEFFKKIRIDRAFIYTWRGYLDTNNNFSMQNIDGTRELQWTNNFTLNPITVVNNFGL